MAIEIHHEVSDEEFIRTHNFDPDVSCKPLDGANLRRTRDIQSRIEDFLSMMCNQSFTLGELSERTRINTKTGLKCLRANRSVVPSRVRKDGYVTCWIQLREEPEATPAGLIEVQLIETRNSDELGKQARADFEWTQTRGNHRRRYF